MARDGDEKLWDGKDHRVEVSAKELLSPPFQQIMRVEVIRKCCGARGTCFLTKPADVQDDSSTGYFLTAGHVLFCLKHKKFAEMIVVHGYVDGHAQTSVVEICYMQDHVSTQGGQPHERSHFRVCEKFLQGSRKYRDDYGVIVFRYSDLRKDAKRLQLVDQAKAFQVADVALETISNITIAGYPGKERRKSTKKMYAHEGRIDLVKNEKSKFASMWYYKIDTTKGQSGSPVFTASNRKVYGIHVRSGWREDNEPFNFAICLNQDLLTSICKWPKEFQSDPKPSAGPSNNQPGVEGEIQAVLLLDPSVFPRGLEDKPDRQKSLKIKLNDIFKVQVNLEVEICEVEFASDCTKPEVVNLIIDGSCCDMDYFEEAQAKLKKPMVAYVLDVKPDQCDIIFAVA